MDDEEDDGFDAVSLNSSIHTLPPQEEVDLTPAVLSRFDEHVANLSLAQRATSAFRAPALRLPWESPFFMGIFADRLPGTVPMPEPLVPLPPSWNRAAPSKRPEPEGAREEPAPPKRPAFPHAVRHLSSLKWHLTDDALRQRAIVRWRVVVEGDLEASSLGRLLTHACNSLTGDDVVLQSITDAFASKSTATLAKRSASLTNYLE